MKKYIAFLLMFYLGCVHADTVKYLNIRNMSNHFLYFSVLNLLNVEVEPAENQSRIRSLPPMEGKYIKIKVKSDEAAIEVFVYTNKGDGVDSNNLVPVCELSAAQKTNYSLPFSHSDILPNHVSPLDCVVTMNKEVLMIQG